MTKETIRAEQQNQLTITNEDKELEKAKFCFAILVILFLFQCFLDSFFSKFN